MYVRKIRTNPFRSINTRINLLHSRSFYTNNNNNNNNNRLYNVSLSCNKYRTINSMKMVGGLSSVSPSTYNLLNNTDKNTIYTKRHISIDMSGRWDQIKEGALFYWDGTKSLFKEARAARKLEEKVDLEGWHSLTWQEHQLITRSRADMSRLVPFILFLVVPFSGWFLPLVIKLFPNMLPTPYWDSSLKKTINIKKFEERVTLAKNLEWDLNTRLLAVDNRSPWYKDVQETKDAFRKLLDMTHRGEQVALIDLARVEKLFKTVFNLGQLPVYDLQRLAKYYNKYHLLPIEPFLVNALYNHIDEIFEDDELLKRLAQTQGLDSLSLEELEEACHFRGFRADGQNKRELVETLREWLALSDQAPTLSSYSLLLFMPIFKISHWGTPVSHRSQLPYELAMDAVLPNRKETAENITQWNLERLREEALHKKGKSNMWKEAIKLTKALKKRKKRT